MADEKCECRLYVGNLDKKITETDIIKMFSPLGTIVSEDFLWHTCGQKRGQPRGYAFIEYSSKEVSLISCCDALISYLVVEVRMQEAQVARTKMNGRLACGRPLVVRFASDKYPADLTSPLPSSSSSLSGREMKIAAIKGKLKSLEGQGCSVKKQRMTEATSGLADHFSNCG